MTVKKFPSKIVFNKRPCTTIYIKLNSKDCLCRKKTVRKFPLKILPNSIGPSLRQNHKKNWPSKQLI
jgi:hypothetical protein